MRLILLLMLALAVVTAQPLSENERIIGGSFTTIEAYPFVAALLLLRYDNAFAQSCAGTIINNRSILTATHCYTRMPVSFWRARVGTTFGNSGGTVFTANQLIEHPAYSRFTLDNDVGILRINGQFTFSNTLHAGAIAGPNYNLVDNQVIWAVGWGLTSFNGAASEQLRHVQIWTINQDICRNRYADIIRPITDNMLCTGWLDVGGRGQCNGDSGGPQLHNGVVVGITSWGEGCADGHFPGITTRVSRFTDWIVNNA